MKNTSKIEENTHLGEKWFVILMILAGWSCYSVADTGLKMLANDGYTVWQILTIGAFFSASAMGAWIYKSRGKNGFIPQEKGWTILRCIVVAILALSITNAFALLPMADVYGITFSAPFLTLILIFFFLKEPVGWPRWIAVAVGFTGVLIIAGPKFASLNWGYLLALNAMIFIAISTIILRKVGKSDHPALYGFYPIIVIFCVTLPFTVNSFIMPETKDLWKFAIQIIGVSGGQILVSYATATAKETAAMAPFVYVQIVWGVLFGYLIFNDPLKTENLIGLPLIIGAGLYMIYRERKVKKIK